MSRCCDRLGTTISGRLAARFIRLANTSGNVGTSCSTPSQAWASRALRVQAAINVIAAARKGINGAVTAMMESAVPGPRLALMPNCSRSIRPSVMQKRGRGHRHRKQHVAAGGHELAQQQRVARHRRGEQRLERAAFAFAHGGVDGQVHATGEQRQDDEEAQHAQHQQRARGRRGDIHVLHGNRRQQLGIDAAQQQALPRDLLRVS